MNRPQKTLPTDEQCVKAAALGDKAAFGILVERYWKMACALALSKVGDPHAAEDIAQESFISAWNYLGRLRRPERFAGWLATIISHRRIDYVRLSIVGKPAVSADESILAAVPAPVANPGLSGEEVGLVRAAIAALPEKMRRVVIMRFLLGLSGREIAEKTGKPHATVRTQLHYAYKRLRKRLAPLFQEVK